MEQPYKITDLVPIKQLFPIVIFPNKSEYSGITFEIELSCVTSSTFPAIVVLFPIEIR